VISEGSFIEIWVDGAEKVADAYHPKGVKDRGVFLRDQALLLVHVMNALKQRNFIEPE
jgi:hypothetical protein